MLEKQMNQCCLVIVFLCAIWLSCTGCGFEQILEVEGSIQEEQSLQEKTKPMILKIACQSTEDSSEVQVLKYFEKLVEVRSENSVDIQIFPSSMLGSVSEMAEGVSLGTIEMAAIGINSYAAYCKDFAVYDSWLFYEPEDFIRVYESSAGARLNQELLETAGIRILSYNLCGPGQMYFWGNKEIISVDDYRGLRVRTNGMATFDIAVAAFQAVPTAVSWMDMYTALQAKTIDVGLGDVENMLTAKYDSIVSYRYAAPDNYFGSSVCISERVWASLSEELQEIIDSSLKEACQDYGHQVYGKKVDADESALIQTGIQTLEMAPGEKERMAVVIREALVTYLNSMVSPEILKEVMPLLPEVTN